MLVGFVLIITLLIPAMVGPGCPSCVDMFILAPPTFGILLVLFAVGYGFGRWSRGV